MMSITTLYGPVVFSVKPRRAIKNTAALAAMASMAYIGCWKVRGGVSPSMRSRIIPPPTAVVRPRMMTPKMSMSRRTPTNAPDTAKAAVPIISRASSTVSKLRSSPRAARACIRACRASCLP